MSQTLQTCIADYIQAIFQRYTGAWCVWCDPRGDWLSLLSSVQRAAGEKSFILRSIDEYTAGAFGSPQARQQVKDWIDVGESFVLCVATSKKQLGWLYTQAVYAEEIQENTLRDMLRMWGWQAQNINTSDDELARLARRNLHLPLGDWDGGQILPEPHRLVEVLAGGALPWQEQQDQAEDPLILQDARVVLELTIGEAGLPPLDEQNLERWRLEALAYLLVTQAYQETQNHRIMPSYFANHDYLIAADKRDFALTKVLDRWIDSVRLSKGLPDRIIDADRILSLGSYFARAELSSATYLSQALERALFANTCTRLIEQSGRDLLMSMAELHDFFEAHAQGFWGGDRHYKARHQQSLPWGELARLSKAVQMLLAAAPVRPWANPSEAVEWYSQQGWQIEQAGEAIMLQLSKPTPELLRFITPLREAYYYHWENYLIQWSVLWQEAGFPLPQYISQGAWLKEQLKETRPTAVIMLDALRYDIGHALCQQINERQGTEPAQIFPARTALPTITALGMGMALPIDDGELVADIVNGKWQLYQRGESLNLSVAENRRIWLRTHLKVAPTALLTMDKKGTAGIPRATGKKPRLFIFDDSLDKLGHDEELEPLGTLDVQERYIQTIEQLRDQGWMRVLVVTDHGFIHWPDIREQRVSFPLYDPAYTSRRALAYPRDAPLKGPSIFAPGEKWRVVVPNGTECFRSYGGLGYFHGGASLQEWIVPCLKIEWPISAKPVDVRIQPLAQILSLRPKITLEVRRESLFNDMAREVELIVRDPERKAILRSQSVMVTPKEEQIAVVLSPVEEAVATRNTPMIIELRDTHSKTVFDSQTTILMVEIENW